MRESLSVSIPTAYISSIPGNKREILIDSESKTSQPPSLKGSLSEYCSPQDAKNAKFISFLFSFDPG